MELRKFIRFVFGMVKVNQGIVEKLQEPELKAAFPADEYTTDEYQHSTHRQFVNEIMLSRAVETFDLYVLTMLRLIFIKRPEMLKSEGAIDVETVFELKAFDDIIRFVAERKVYELGYKSLRELRKYIITRTGIELFKNQETFERVLLASELRNLIAHNDCRVNDLFKRRTAGLPDAGQLAIAQNGKVEIPDEWLRRASYTLDAVVFDFDAAAAPKFGLDTMPAL
jgi:hypothetical protein